VAIDRGAEFVHGRSEILLGALHAAHIAVSTVEPPQHLARGGRLVRANRLWTRALDLSSKLQPLRDQAASGDRSGASALARSDWRRQGSPDERALARGYLEGFNAMELRRASLRALLEQQRAADQIAGDQLGRPRGGYRALPLHLAARFEAARRRRAARDGGTGVRLGVIVDRVDWGRAGVTVEARAPDGVRLAPIRARAAIVSVPLGVLQTPPGATGAIRFAPSLPAPVRRAIGALAMGGVTKVVLRFNRTPWRGPLGFLHVPGAAFPTLWTLAESPRPVLVAWAAGPAADRLRGLDDGQLRRRALATLARALSTKLSDLETFVDGVEVAAWNEDPFARGAYSWVPVGASAAAATLARPIGGTLIMAGEATETHGHAGTVHGALMTGERAARDARALLDRDG
ncbi:MAG TPA: NAD(P)/FAD-dependent oxidoreductase, partial [Polyangia bacterium]|nr:NAD(P)/FAD-dependent oxidoreductase [Polyangia bacterium]